MQRGRAAGMDVRAAVARPGACSCHAPRACPLLRDYFEDFVSDGALGALAPEAAPDEGDWLVLAEDEEGLLLAEPEVLAPAELPPAEADESPFTMASNSERLSCPSLFLSAFSKSRRSAPRLDLLAPADALPPEDALSLLFAVLLAPADALPEALESLCDIDGFACASLLFLLASLA
jgi:hypothetical protein